MSRVVVLDYLRIVRARWRWVAWGLVLTLAATAAALVLSPPLYPSRATVFVRTPGDVSRTLEGGDFYAQQRAETYAAAPRCCEVNWPVTWRPWRLCPAACVH